MLVEFASAVEAVRCAVDVQRGMIDRNADVPADERIEFRVGIHVGDIIEDDGDIFGDGVNVAARLEGIAVRGGICVSRQALDQIEGILKIQFRELGRQNLKNISRPIEVFSMRRRSLAISAITSRWSSRTYPTGAMRIVPRISRFWKAPMRYMYHSGGTR